MDLCLSNALVKTGLGLGTGIVLSVLLFRRACSAPPERSAVAAYRDGSCPQRESLLTPRSGRTFPVWLSTGAGLGSAYTDCQIAFNPSA